MVMVMVIVMTIMKVKIMIGMMRRRVMYHGLPCICGVVVYTLLWDL